jgi:hypothetical protein
MRKKAIKAEYRKNSESFPEWLKYEVTILNEDGTIEKVPAYGKDLQDALSRVVHDDRVEKLQSKAEFIPRWVWSLVFIGYMTSISIWSVLSNKPKILIFGLISISALIITIDRLLRKRNINK